MLRLLMGLVALGAVAMMPSMGRAAIGELDPAFVRSEVPCDSTDTQLSDRGGTFAVCLILKYAPGGLSPNGVEYKVLKFDARGRPDLGWGNAGVTTYNTDRQFYFHRAVSLRDGGMVLFLSNYEREGIALRFSKTGELLPEFGAKRDVALFLRDPPVDTAYGWQLAGGVEGPDGDFAALAISAGLLGKRTQSLAVRRFGADGQFIEELRYSVDLDAFNSASGVVTDVAWGLFSWGLEGNKLAILRATAGSERLVGLTLAPDGTQTARKTPLIPGTSGPHYRDPALYVLADGKFLALTGTGVFAESRVFRWNADGSRDRTFGTEGSTDRLPIFFGSCSASLALHAGGEFSVKGASLGYSGGQMGFGFPATCMTGLQIALTSHGRHVVGQWAVRPDGNTGLARHLIDRNGGILYHELYAVDRTGGVAPRETYLLTRVVGYAPRADVKVVEYYNPDLDHYFITAHEHEIDFVDKGNAGATWRRTGSSFGAWNVDTPMPGTNTVCRFYGDVAAGPNSHFFSAQAFECDLLRAMELATPVGKPAWRYERDAFRITVPVDGACPANLTPVTRFYNGKQGAVDGPNHRYVTRQVDIDAMTKRGWFNEGVRMCAVLE